jgi:hypothetical protein
MPTIMPASPIMMSSAEMAAPFGRSGVRAATRTASGRPIHALGQPEARGAEAAPLTRSLDEVLRTLERLLTNPRPTNDQLVAARQELVAYRNTTTNPDLGIALDRLCEAIDAYITLQKAPTDSDRQLVTSAVQGVRAAMPARSRSTRRSDKNFWE